MLSKLITGLTIMAGLCAAADVSAQEPEVIIGETGFPDRVWGEQTMQFDVTNQTDWLKFIIVETDVTFEGSYVTPHRVVRTSFILEPSVKLTVNPKLEIPGNYGQMVLWVRIFDVVDTLDDISLGVQLFEQPFRVRFLAPEAVHPYFEERLSLPPLVGDHGLFDNEFQRLMLFMTAEGKTLEEIIQICQVDSGFARWAADDMVRARVLRKEEDRYEAAVPVITSAFARDGRELADRFSDQLAALLTENLKGRSRLMDSLVQAGVYSRDSTNFTEGGTLLYQPYPLVLGFYLWQTLGQKFITGNQPLLIYAATDPCNAKIGRYMYMVQGGDYYLGNHYYSARRTGGGLVTHFGDRVPVVACRPGFEKKLQARQNVDWSFDRSYAPEAFVYDTTLINPMLRLLDRGVEEVLRATGMEFRQLNAEHGHKGLPLGTRYWFWNLAATRTVAKLVEAGTLTRSGNGQYRFMEKSK